MSTLLDFETQCRLRLISPCPLIFNGQQCLEALQVRKVAFTLGIVGVFYLVPIKVKSRLYIMKVQAKSAARLGSYNHHVTGALSLPKRRILALRVLPESLHQLVLLFGVLEEDVTGVSRFSGIC